MVREKAIIRREHFDSEKKRSCLYNSFCLSVSSSQDPHGLYPKRWASLRIPIRSDPDPAFIKASFRIWSDIKVVTGFFFGFGLSWCVGASKFKCKNRIVFVNFLR